MTMVRSLQDRPALFLNGLLAALSPAMAIFRVIDIALSCEGDFELPLFHFFRFLYSLSGALHRTNHARPNKLSYPQNSLLLVCIPTMEIFPLNPLLWRNPSTHLSVFHLASLLFEKMLHHRALRPKSKWKTFIIPSDD